MRPFLKNVKILLQKKLFYEYTFAIFTIASFCVWLFLLLRDGTNSQQYKVFFESTEDFFADMVNVVGYTAQRDVYNNTMYTPLGDKPYPALSYIITYFFSRTVDMKPYLKNEFFLNMYWDPKFLIIYIFFILATVISLYQIIHTYKSGANKIKTLIAVSLLFSSPLLYTIERGNFVLHSMICTFIYLMYYDSSVKWKREMALICLAIATALKITPAVLGILLIFDKRWKEIVHVIVYGLIFGFLPFLFFKGGMKNVLAMYRNMKMNLKMYASAEGCTLYSAYLNWGGKQSVAINEVLKYITYAVCILFMFTMPLMKYKWQKWLAVLLVLVVAPSRSGQYCIVYLIPAMVSFLNVRRHKISEIWILMMFWLILNPIQGNFWKIIDFHFAIVGLMIYMVVVCFKCLDQIVIKKYKKLLL